MLQQSSIKFAAIKNWYQNRRFQYGKVRFTIMSFLCWKRRTVLWVSGAGASSWLLKLFNAGLFKGQFTTAQVGEDEAPQALGSRRRAGWGVGRSVPSPPGEGALPLPTRGGGSAPPQKFFLILALNMVSFGAFWMVFFTVQLPVLHAKL